MVKLEELENWIGPGEAANRMGVSRQWVHKLLEERKLRAVKTRAGWIIDPVSVDQAKRERDQVRREDGQGN